MICVRTIVEYSHRSRLGPAWVFPEECSRSPVRLASVQTSSVPALPHQGVHTIDKTGTFPQGTQSRRRVAECLLGLCTPHLFPWGECERHRWCIRELLAKPHLHIRRPMWYSSDPKSAHIYHTLLTNSRTSRAHTSRQIIITAIIFAVVKHISYLNNDKNGVGHVMCLTWHLVVNCGQ